MSILNDKGRKYLIKSVQEDQTRSFLLIILPFTVSKEQPKNEDND